MPSPHQQPSLPTHHSDPESTVRFGPSSGRRRSSAVSPLTGAPEGPAFPSSPSTIEPPKPTSTVSLQLVLVVSLCLFTIGPSITLWLLSWDAGDKGLKTMLDLSENLLEDISKQLRSSLILRAADSVSKLLSESESVMNETMIRMKWDGLVSRSNGTDPPVTIFDDRLYNMGYTFVQYQFLTMYVLNVISKLAPWDPPPYPDNPLPTLAYVYTRSGYNIAADIMEDTIYFGNLTDTGPKNESTIDVCLVDQNTGAVQFCAVTLPGASVSTPIDSFPHQPGCHWLEIFSLDPYVGVPSLALQCQIPFANKESVVLVEMMTNIYVISSFLASLVFVEKDRLFLSHRNEHGYLLGASHGKFYSHSDHDYFHRNPMAEPLPLDEFRQYTALNSTDPAIQASGEFLFSRFKSWDLIPEVNLVVTLAGWPYWMVTHPITSQIGLKLQLYLLADRESRVGLVESTKEKTLSEILTTNKRLIVILSCVVAAAVVIALVISIFLTRSLSRLASGMDALALLDFERGLIERAASRYSEVVKCETSFLALGRGLKAFVKYVPRDVVRMMLTGEMVSENIMMHRNITVLFMDIVGFTEICEKISPQALMKLTTEYLQSMCQVIVASGGVLDKFIGDCIMAIWNAPVELEGHEAAACEAALQCQVRCHHLGLAWAAEGLPKMRFRLGINTGSVWVGNYGCDYRISYTCLGDGVNLASRLEAVNKYFGTTVLVSLATKIGADQLFCFRKIGKITVPGKSEVVEVYELLCKQKSALRESTSFRLSMTAQSPLLEVHSDGGVGSPLVLSQPLNPFRAVPPRASVVTNDSERASGADDPEVFFHWELFPYSVVEAMANCYEQGLELLSEGKIDLAVNQFELALQKIPTDGASRFLLDFCHPHQQLQKGKQAFSWDGVLRFDKK